MARPITPALAADALIELVDRPGRPIVMIERAHPPSGWAIPGGFVDVGETVEQAAIREAIAVLASDLCVKPSHGNGQYALYPLKVAGAAGLRALRFAGTKASPWSSVIRVIGLRLRSQPPSAWNQVSLSRSLTTPPTMTRDGAATLALATSAGRDSTVPTTTCWWRVVPCWIRAAGRSGSQP